jgi:hypothetical protein
LRELLPNGFLLKGKPKMFIDKTEIEIWSNHGNYENPKKKPKQEKIGTLVFNGYAQIKNLDRVLESLDDNLFQHDAVEYRVKLSIKNA